MVEKSYRVIGHFADRAFLIRRIAPAGSAVIKYYDTKMLREFAAYADPACIIRVKAGYQKKRISLAVDFIV